MENQKQAFKAISKIVLNNWHYIDYKVLTFHDSINFFTGHSGSGKSTVIDAIQIVLYANTDGRGFFNKAAADDSDRNLMEYLRGMINIGENGQAEYKRNKNFSTTIVLEFTQTVSKEKECVGVVFDVDTASNDFNRLFFWHRGEAFSHDYRTAGRCMTINEVKACLKKDYDREDYFYSSNNERFRRNLYDIYLGGLDGEKFPRLFKRAIPFRMNIRLEDFVKEYICMEQDIHIEEMQESVVLYGRMRKKIEDARKELEELDVIEAQYQAFEQAVLKTEELVYRKDRLHALELEQALLVLQEKILQADQDVTLQEQALAGLEEQKNETKVRYDELNRMLAGSGYSDLERKKADLEESILLLERSERKWKETAQRLLLWEEEEVVSNQILWDIEKFGKGTLQAEELSRLKKGLAQVREDIEKQRQEAASDRKALQKEIQLLEQDLMELRLGKKAYPKELEQARRKLMLMLYDRTGKEVQVKILADLLDIRDERWRNAIEGYLGNHKLALMVEPQYVKEAYAAYEELGKQKKGENAEGIAWERISLVDTERVLKQDFESKKGSLAEEVLCSEQYVRAFVRYLLGNVMKCESIEELRNCRVGVTADCMLYQSFQLRKMNPDYYTRRAYIGEKSMRERQKELQNRLESLEKKQAVLDEELENAKRLLSMEYLTASSDEYFDWCKDSEEKKRKENQKKKILEQMAEIGLDAIERMKEEIRLNSEKQLDLERKADQLKLQIHDRQTGREKYQEEYLAQNEELQLLKNTLAGSSAQEQAFTQYLDGYRKEARQEAQKVPEYHKLFQQTLDAIKKSQDKCQLEKNQLIDVRSNYLRKHPERDFSASAEDNEVYRKLREELWCERLAGYEEKARQQAQIAVEHFREDFVYKIRSAIREAFVRRDELNRIIRNLNFGKDRYQFKITRNKGVFGAYYDMFMDETLAIHPESLSGTAGNTESQMNMFSMAHQDKYGVLMNDLVSVFIPPEDASAKEQEEALENMSRYADYRSYLSFEMEQIVEGEERLVIGLSKMIKKNSGGEGQNPLYVALLASFAQAYRINLSNGITRRPTMRLVILDEAFSKMDAEKVASCIDLIRGLGFQAIISATNDKIQNYLENVDKTFVYANPNKKSISIQQFEKQEFEQLVAEE